MPAVRKDEVLLARLRIGHTRHLVCGEDAPVCAYWEEQTIISVYFYGIPIS